MSSAFGGAVDLAAHMANKANAPAADDLTKGIDLYDSEIIKIEKVMMILRNRSTSARNYEDFSREIKERFQDIGLVVDVVWYETNVTGVLMPEIVVKARTEAKVFDRDQMTHEVTSDLLGLGEGGVIKTDKEKVAQMMDGSYKGQTKDVHKH